MFVKKKEESKDTLFWANQTKLNFYIPCLFSFIGILIVIIASVFSISSFTKGITEDIVFENDQNYKLIVFDWINTEHEQILLTNTLNNNMNYSIALSLGVFKLNALGGYDFSSILGGYKKWDMIFKAQETLMIPNEILSHFQSICKTLNESDYYIPSGVSFNILNTTDDQPVEGLQISVKYPTPLLSAILIIIVCIAIAFSVRNLFTSFCQFGLRGKNRDLMPKEDGERHLLFKSYCSINVMNIGVNVICFLALIGVYLNIFASSSVQKLSYLLIAAYLGFSTLLNIFYVFVMIFNFVQIVVLTSFFVLCVFVGIFLYSLLFRSSNLEVFSFYMIIPSFIEWVFLIQVISYYLLLGLTNYFFNSMFRRRSIHGEKLFSSFWWNYVKPIPSTVMIGLSLYLNHEGKYQSPFFSSVLMAIGLSFAGIYHYGNIILSGLGAKQEVQIKTVKSLMNHLSVCVFISLMECANEIYLTWNHPFYSFFSVIFYVYCSIIFILPTFTKIFSFFGSINDNDSRTNYSIEDLNTAEDTEQRSRPRSVVYIDASQNGDLDTNNSLMNLLTVTSSSPTTNAVYQRPICEMLSNGVDNMIDNMCYVINAQDNKQLWNKLDEIRMIENCDTGLVNYKCSLPRYVKTFDESKGKYNESVSEVTYENHIMKIRRISGKHLKNVSTFQRFGELFENFEFVFFELDSAFTKSKDLIDFDFKEFESLYSVITSISHANSLQISQNTVLNAMDSGNDQITNLLGRLTIEPSNFKNFIHNNSGFSSDEVEKSECLPLSYHLFDILKINPAKGQLIDYLLCLDVNFEPDNELLGRFIGDLTKERDVACVTGRYNFGIKQRMLGFKNHKASVWKKAYQSKTGFVTDVQKGCTMFRMNAASGTSIVEPIIEEFGRFVQFKNKEDPQKYMEIKRHYTDPMKDLICAMLQFNMKVCIDESVFCHTSKDYEKRLDNRMYSFKSDELNSSYLRNLHFFVDGVMNGSTSFASICLYITYNEVFSYFNQVTIVLLAIFSGSFYNVTKSSSLQTGFYYPIVVIVVLVVVKVFTDCLITYRGKIQYAARADDDECGYVSPSAGTAFFLSLYEPFYDCFYGVVSVLNIVKLKE
eukprot:TRINITY_DN7208_c0_g1_i1.p1 TRINITY_DN7208_c0_g1~~TRINITY_DN7208_c0_g1_i1.p1  ORF type:complete len:1109 (+),score=248.77 TRINITY_DN7208_c0_g1_i1:30-3329(+)